MTSGAGCRSGDAIQWAQVRTPWVPAMVAVILLAASCVPAPMPLPRVPEVGVGDAALGPDPVDPSRASFTVSLGTEYVDGDGNFSAVEPGDVIALESGTRGRLRVENLHGTPEAPIVIVNDGGVVNIQAGSEYAALDIRDSSHLRITGSGGDRYVGSSAYEPGLDLSELEAVQDAGIVVTARSSTTRGVAFKYFEDATNRYPDGGIVHQGLELDHLEVHGTRNGFHGPESDRLSDAYTLVGYKLHHNYVHDTTTHEGAYLGSGNYPDAYADTGGWDVYRNFMIRTGRDTVQIGNSWIATGPWRSRLHHNVFSAPGQNDDQDSFNFIARVGTTIDVYSNYFFDAGRHGIMDMGLGGSRYWNNVIVRAGAFTNGSSVYGIRISQSSRPRAKPGHLNANPGGGKVWNNTIIGMQDSAIHFANGQKDPVNEAYNNAMVGNGHTITFSGSTADGRHNRSSGLSFIDASGDDYRLKPDSLAIQAGLNLSEYFQTDVAGHPRPASDAWDIGAHQFVGP